ncbi:MAG: hypothetical protein ACE15D_03860 [Candidatus Eisenbacteria bacterium]
MAGRRIAATNAGRTAGRTGLPNGTTTVMATGRWIAVTTGPRDAVTTVLRTGATTGARVTSARIADASGIATIADVARARSEGIRAGCASPIRAARSPDRDHPTASIRRGTVRRATPAQATAAACLRKIRR